MKLYYSPTSPYVRKCLVAAHELGIIDRIQVAPVVTMPTQHSAELMEKNPLCKLPTLVLDDGGVLYDSRVISEYLDNLAGGSLLPAGQARWPVLVRQALADGLLDAALLMRYEVTLRPEALRWADWSRTQEEKIRGAVREFENTVADWRAGLDLGTIATASALGYLDLRFPELNWRKGAAGLAAWFAEFRERPSMKATEFKA